MKKFFVRILLVIFLIIFLNFLKILFCGLFVAIILYPLLHEAGHALVATIVAEDVNISIFPLPRVICHISNTQVAGISAIGISGMFFPLMVSLLIKCKGFWLWLISFYLKAISIIGFVLSYVALICHHYGVIWENEDIIKVLEISGMESSFFEVTLLVLLCANIWNVWCETPILKITEFLLKNNRKTKTIF